MIKQILIDERNAADQLIDLFDRSPAHQIGNVIEVGLLRLVFLIRKRINLLFRDKMRQPAQRFDDVAGVCRGADCVPISTTAFKILALPMTF